MFGLLLNIGLLIVAVSQFLPTSNVLTLIGWFLIGLASLVAIVDYLKKVRN